MARPSKRSGSRSSSNRLTRFRPPDARRSPSGPENPVPAFAGGGVFRFTPKNFAQVSVPSALHPLFRFLAFDSSVSSFFVDPSFSAAFPDSSLFPGARHGPLSPPRPAIPTIQAPTNLGGRGEGGEGGERGGHRLLPLCEYGNGPGPRSCHTGNAQDHRHTPDASGQLRSPQGASGQKLRVPQGKKSPYFPSVIASFAFFSYSFAPILPAPRIPDH